MLLAKHGVLLRFAKLAQYGSSYLMPAGLMPKDELDMIINDIRPIMKAAQPGVPDTWDNLYAFFLNRVRDNLHVMLCFSPVGNKFSTRAQHFPGLINGCTIDWFLPWPEEALTSGELAVVCAGMTAPPKLSFHIKLHPSSIWEGGQGNNQDIHMCATMWAYAAFCMSAALQAHSPMPLHTHHLTSSAAALQCLASSLMSSRWLAVRRTAPS